MTQSIKVVALIFDRIEGHVHVRLGGVQIRTTIVVGDVHVEATRNEQTNIDDVSIQYRHFITAVTEDKAPFYDLSLVVRMLVSVDRAVYPIDGDVMDFLDHALTFGLPVSALKLKELCGLLDISPPPPIPLTPDRTANDQPQDG